MGLLRDIACGGVGLAAGIALSIVSRPADRDRSVEGGLPAAGRGAESHPRAEVLAAHGAPRRDPSPTLAPDDEAGLLAWWGTRLVPFGPGGRSRALASAYAERGLVDRALVALDRALSEGADPKLVAAQALALRDPIPAKFAEAHPTLAGFSDSMNIAVRDGRFEDVLLLLERAGPDEHLKHEWIQAALRSVPERVIDLLRTRGQLGEGWIVQAAHAIRERDSRDAALAWLRRTVQPAEMAEEIIEWIANEDAKWGIELAEAQVARTGSPAAWLLLARAREQAGDRRGAFDAYARAIEAGADPVDISWEVSGLDPRRAIDLLTPLVPGRHGALTEALVRALLLDGREVEAASVLVRIALASEDYLPLAAHLDPAAIVGAYRPRFADLDAVPQAEFDALAEYGLALVRLGRGAEAVPVLRRIEQRSRYVSVAVLVALAEHSPDSRPLVDRRIDAVGAWADRIRVLYALGRRAEALAMIDAPMPVGTTAEAWAPLAAFAPERTLHYLRAQLEQDPERSDLVIALARGLAATGDRAGARALWDRLDPYELDVEQLVERAALR